MMKKKSLFLTDRGKPVTVSWIQRMVKMTACEAGLEIKVTCNILQLGILLQPTPQIVMAKRLPEVF